MKFPAVSKKVAVATLNQNPSLQPIFEHYGGTCIVFRYLAHTYKEGRTTVHRDASEAQSFSKGEYFASIKFSYTVSFFWSGSSDFFKIL